ncbi:tRNA (adenosine(37)-N6)-dimethylallyltransferase MiaA [bacterium]|nr:tRNA (adenosine(37)-N6)-dimethylallyltransferase MiaA [bacterium]
MNKKKLLVILGPTAVGKTKLAIDLAKKLNAEIVSADSMLVYKGMDIGSAKPTPEERSQIPHYMIDITEPNNDYDVGLFIEQAVPKIENIYKKGKTAIVCGGTNYYVYTLLEGSYDAPESDTEIRAKYENIAKEKGNEHLHSLLKNIDPDSYNRLKINDVKRVSRALEVYEITGKPLSLMKKKQGIAPKYNVIKIGLMLDKKKLFSRIEQRVDNMLKKGLIQEVELLIKKGLTNSKTAQQGVGYKEVIEYTKNNSRDIELLKNQIIQNTRKLVKKQLTWLKKDATIKWFDAEDYAKALKEIQKII